MLSRQGGFHAVSSFRRHRRCGRIERRARNRRSSPPTRSMRSWPAPRPRPNSTSPARWRACASLPQTAPGPDVAPPPPPARDTWYTEPGQGVRQSLFRGHQDPFVLGADHERRHHPDRHALRLQFGGSDRRRHEEARPRSCQREIRHHQPRAWRPCRRRQADAGSLRLPHRHGRPDWDSIEKLGQPISEGQAQARHRGDRRPEDHARRRLGDAGRDARPHARHAVDDFPGEGQRQAAHGRLFGRHRVQLPQRRAAFRHLHQLAAQDGRRRGRARAPPS